MMHTGNKLTGFIIASAMIHVGFFLYGQTTLLLPSSEGSSMLVSLSDKPVSPKSLSKNNHRDTAPIGLAKPTHSAKPTSRNNKANTTTESNQRDKTNVMNSGANNVATQPQIIAHIKHELRHYFHYPEMARRRGWQGHVVINMDITSAGKIQNVTLKRSSGYRILDNAAIASVNKIGLIPLVKQNGYTGTQTIQLPIEYQLKG